VESLQAQGHFTLSRTRDIRVILVSFAPAQRIIEPRISGKSYPTALATLKVQRYEQPKSSR